MVKAIINHIVFDNTSNYWKSCRTNVSIHTFEYTLMLYQALGQVVPIAPDSPSFFESLNFTI